MGCIGDKATVIAKEIQSYTINNTVNFLELCSKKLPGHYLLRMTKDQIENKRRVFTLNLRFNCALMTMADVFEFR